MIIITPPDFPPVLLGQCAHDMAKLLLNCHREEGVPLLVGDTSKTQDLFLDQVHLGLKDSIAGTLWADVRSRTPLATISLLGLGWDYFMHTLKSMFMLAIPRLPDIVNG